MKKIVYGVEMQENRFYSKSGLERKFGGKVKSIDCSYIVISNDNWDNDMVLYIDDQRAFGWTYRYIVSEHN